MNRPVSDAIVFFGATGDLAYEQIFPVLHVDIAEQTGELDKGFGVEATMAGETVLGARLQLVERPSSLGNADDRLIEPFVTNQTAAPMTTMHDLVFLFDVDNTLLDNDRVQADLATHLTEAYGVDACKLYWAIFERLRRELGYADYLGALERFRLEKMHDPRVLRMSSWLVDYPFADRLYAGALNAIKHVQQWGPAVILSDGDAVFQPRKVERSGLWAAFDGRVLIYVHKERELADVERFYPARRYVMVDDKLRILNLVKKVWGERVTTIFLRQGHYARDPQILAGCRPADIQLDRLSDLNNYALAEFVTKSGRRNHASNKSTV